MSLFRTAVAVCLVMFVMTGCTDHVGGFVVRNDTDHTLLVARAHPGDAVRVVRVAPAGSQGLAFEGGESLSEISVIDPSTCQVVYSASFTMGGLRLLVIDSNGLVDGGSVSPSVAGDELRPTAQCASPT